MYRLPALCARGSVDCVRTANVFHKWKHTDCRSGRAAITKAWAGEVGIHISAYSLAASDVDALSYIIASLLPSHFYLYPQPVLSIHETLASKDSEKITSSLSSASPLLIPPAIALRPLHPPHPYLQPPQRRPTAALHYAA